MDADWYEDPLGRFDGRFFNGERWTERVSADGALATDPNFPPDEALNAASTASESDLSTDHCEPDEFETHEEPAVSRFTSHKHLQASLMEESPARTVAVLDHSVARPHQESAVGGGRRFLAWGLLGLVSLLAIIGLLVWALGGSDQVVAEPVNLDAQQEERLQDLAEGGTDSELEADVIEELEVDAPLGAVEADAVFDKDELVEVGALRVLNGASMLGNLEDWHSEFAAERGIELGPEAGCWFGQLGGAAVQVAQCGPVGGSSASEFLFDLVPLLFEDVDGGQIAQPVVDAVTIDAVLANALTLVGSAESAPPPQSLEGATSGD